MSKVKVISAIVFVYQLFLILLMKVFKKKGTERKETSICQGEKFPVKMKRSADRNS